ncbi:MAG: pyrroloquinoline quinone precursor peptide PqqA [Methylococcales bacterium]|nr:pyrroloquinoline quinone precursor peptide PqqA [Methylococcales bacterium]
MKWETLRYTDLRFGFEVTMLYLQPLKIKKAHSNFWMSLFFVVSHVSQIFC